MPTPALTPAEATALLFEVQTPRQLWQTHCLRVAQAARRLCRGLANEGTQIPEDFVVASALVHDIGRHIAHGKYHAWLGYRFLEARDQRDLGRGCVTHWLRGRCRDELEEDGALLPSFIDCMFRTLDLEHMTLVDKILSASDFFAAHDHLVPYANRKQDLKARYGDVAFIDRSAELATAHLDELCALAKADLTVSVLTAEQEDPYLEFGVPHP